MIANRKQRFGVLVASLVAAFLLMRPPWRVWYGEGGDKFFVPTAHDWIFSPPVGTLVLDFARLGFELLVIAVLAFGALVLLRD